MAVGRRGSLTQLPDGDPKGVRSFGTTLVLTSSAMMFGSLVLLYVLLRADAPTWPPPESSALPTALPALATGVIALSSLTMELGVRAVRRARPWALPRWIACTFALGLVFLLSISWLWAGLVSAGFSSQNPHGGLFYVMTAFHGLHVAIAMGLLGWLYAGARRGRYHGRDTVAVRMVGRFWHFLGVCWLSIFLALFMV